LLLLLWLS
jgi:hypothetical protein